MNKISTVFNLTAKDIEIYDEKNILMVRLPSQGELRLRKSSTYRHYPPHHIHYYDESTRTEAGIPVLAAPAHEESLDPTSLGYAVFQSATRTDCVIVPSHVVSYLYSIKEDHDLPQIFVARPNDSIVSQSEEQSQQVVRTRNLEWCF